MIRRALDDTELRRRRRDALRAHPTQTGLEYVEVDGSTLLLHFVPPEPESEKSGVPAGFSIANLRITGTLGGADQLTARSLNEREDGVVEVAMTRPSGAAH